MTEEEIVIVRAEGVCTITLNRPQARNALSSSLLAALVEALEGADADPEVSAVVLTGADPAFCAGEDLKEMGEGDFSWPVIGPPFPRMSKALIGAVNGTASTGGLELALACDFLIASERARFGDAHARLGLVPFWGLCARLPAFVGLPRAREMCLTGAYLDAAEAERWGLVNRVVAHQELLDVATAAARAVAEAEPRALNAVREQLESQAEALCAPGWAAEARIARRWATQPFEPAAIASRRDAALARGRANEP